jgi:aminoglycoside phosphotransferase (APT) family kinase protein
MPDDLARRLCDPERLAAWLDREDLARGTPLDVTRITTGHSNETFLVWRGPHVWVLRRPPRVPLAPTAHDMGREARLLRALATTAVPVPRLVAACLDTDVIGAPFHLTDRLDGWVIRDAIPAAFREERGAAVGRAFMEALAALHAVDWQTLGLADFGKPDGFLARQVTRWSAQLESYRTRPLPDMDALAAWLRDRRPAGASPTLIHGDYHLDNVMYVPSLPPRVLAILDWETATLGDPLLDVGLCTGLWPDPTDDDLPFGQSLSRAELGAGIGTRGDLVAAYAAATDRPLDHLPYYQALGLFRLACILEGSWARHQRGAADDPFFAHLEAGVPAMARRARTLAGV